MGVIIIVAGAVILGVAAIVWLLIAEKKSSSDFIKQIDPENVSSGEVLSRLGLEEDSLKIQKAEKFSGKSSKGFKFSFLNKFKKNPKAVASDGPTGTHKAFISLKDALVARKLNKKNDGEALLNRGATVEDDVSEIPEHNLDISQKDEAQGTISITTSPVDPVSNEMPMTLTVEEEQGIKNNIEASAELEELKEKYERLERLFQEKGAAYEKAQAALVHEQEHRKEFDTVKGVLEKELAQAKEAAKAQAAIGEKTQELDHKVEKFERELKEKEAKINELLDQLHGTEQVVSPATPNIAQEQVVIKDVGQEGGEQEGTEGVRLVQEPDEQSDVKIISASIPMEELDLTIGDVKEMSSIEMASIEIDVSQKKPLHIAPEPYEEDVIKIEDENESIKVDDGGQEPSEGLKLSPDVAAFGKDDEGVSLRQGDEDDGVVLRPQEEDEIKKKEE